MSIPAAGMSGYAGADFEERGRPCAKLLILGD